MTPKIFECNVENPHFDHIKQGWKTVEGRVYVGKWTEIETGDILIIRNGEESVKRRVVTIWGAWDFKQLYKFLGKSLLPEVNSPEEAEKVYRQYFSDELVKEHGVVGFILGPC